MKKKILIINEYAGTPRYGVEFRHYYLGKELCKLDKNVTIISSSYSHLFSKFPKEKEETIDKVKYLWLKTFNYGRGRNKKRVLKWFVFTLKLFFLPFSLKEKPDVVIVSPMAPFCVIPSYFLAKLYKAKFVYEVKDIWPLSLMEVGNFSRNHPLIKIMSFCERFAIKKSDTIISNLPNYGQHMKENLKINKSFKWISNGIDTSEYKNLDIKSNESFTVGYIGSFGKSNSIDYLLEAIKLINKEYQIEFLFVGSGELKEDIIKASKQDERIIFKGRVTKEKAFEYMKKSTILFKGNPNKKLYEYGTSPIKLFEYLMAGKPILHSTNLKNDIVKISNCGISVKGETPELIAKEIIEFYNMSQEKREELGKNGKDFVEKNFNYNKLAKDFIKAIEGE